MQEFGVEPGRVSVVDEQRAGGERYRQEDASPDPGRTSPDRSEPSRMDEELLAQVQALELELERYRMHAERTSKLFLAATKYAEWVRENARRDAELALRKAHARVERLELSAEQLAATEAELARKQEELERLEALTEETRARLSSYLTAGLEALNASVDPGSGGRARRTRGDFQDTLHEQLTSTSAPIREREHEERDD